MPKLFTLKQMMKKSISLLFVIIAISVFQVFAQDKYLPSWESVDKRPIPAWFENAKFGIFIHWGLFSVPAWGPTEGNVYEKYAEWYWWRQSRNGQPSKSFTDFHNQTFGENTKYEDFASGFKAEMFYPDQWAEVFKKSGARYVVLTSKHHEGFTLWPSAVSWNWNSVDVGPHRDLCGELTKSVKEKGLYMGFYYSLYEWFNPLYKNNLGKYVDDHMIPQMKDLVTRYTPDILWTDGEWEHSAEEWRSTDFLAWLYNDSPVKNSIVVNDRWGKGTRSKHGGIFTTEYDLVHEGNSKETKFEHPWEECRGIGGSFGYNRNENLANYETSKSLVHILINKVARGGNLLLNIGPTADGRIPVIMQQRLSDIGGWLQINGEAIYDTRKWEQAPPIKGETTTYFTVKGNDLFVIVTNWQNTAIVVDGIKNAEGVSLLGYSGKVRYSLSGGKIKIIPPAINPGNNPCEYAWVFKIKGADSL